MALSRSESRQRRKKQRSNRLRRLLVVNAVMLLLIGVLVVVYVVQLQDSGKKLDTTANNGAQDQGGKNAEGSQAADTAPAGNENGAASNQNGNSGGSAANDAPAGNESTDDAASASNDGASSQAENANDGGSGGHSEEEQPSGGAIAPSGEKQVKLSFAGDILLAASVEKLMLKNGFEYPYAKVLKFLNKADFMAANLETPVTLRGTPAADKQYVYKSSPDALPALKESGIDLVNLANNHSMDQGEEGLLDTIDYLNKAGLANMGAGRDDIEAYKPVIVKANGISVAYIGLSRVIPTGSWKAGKAHPGLAESYDPTRAVAAIKQAKEQADLVVVMVHWGTELSDSPNPDQTRLGHTYVDAGADLVIGSHPHVLQGMESYKGKWIAYSLGNFIFAGMPNEKTKDTGVLDAACDAAGRCSLQFHPMRADQSQPAPLAGDDASALLKRLSAISIHASINSNGDVKPKE
ncbi:CapA family protein [Paenibacillus sp. R14(2021)]|uniref:CapA family protein n=1 Tax=Paenibacillus sp. R14(2021) TaxID=2859228 RepID=UPI001C614DFA|nr:CapA family protein [Paenibacillus sp. R14(2021)]